MQGYTNFSSMIALFIFSNVKKTDTFSQFLVANKSIFYGGNQFYITLIYFVHGQPLACPLSSKTTYWQPLGQLEVQFLLHTLTQLVQSGKNFGVHILELTISTVESFVILVPAIGAGGL